MADSLIIGAPGLLFSWVEALLQRALDYALRPAEIIRLDRSCPPAASSQGEAPDRLFFCNFPHAALLDSIRAGRLRVLALIDDPHDGVRYRSALTGSSTLQTLREQSLAYTAYPCLGDTKNLHFIFRGHAAPAAGLIATALDQLNVVLKAGCLPRLIEEFTAPDNPESLEAALVARGQGHRPPEAPVRDASEGRLVDQVLAPLFDLLRSRTPAPIEWPRELFFSGDRPAEPLPQVVDLTGPARVICYGPYLYLPPGKYRLAIILAFSSDARGLSFLVTCTRQLGRVCITRKRIVPPGRGIFAAPLTLDHEHPQDDLEVVLQMERGAIGGRMMLLRVVVERVAEDPGESQSGPAARPLPGQP